MASMKDIARYCGVSVATVSKALNGLPDIGEDTRQRICAAAQELGYMANSAARALKTSRTYNLGVLLLDERRNGLNHEYFSAMLESFKVEAEKHGYDITFINENVGGKLTSYLHHCMYRGVDGVLIACIDFVDPRIQELVDGGIPVVTIDHVFPNRLAVVSDNAEGVEALVRYVYDKGHRRIAYLHGEPSRAATHRRLEGFHRACEALGLEIPPEYIKECIYHDPDRCAEATREILALPNRPTCILFPDDYSFIGGINVIAEAGLRMPEDISAVGYDGIHLAKAIHLTTYTQDTLGLGRTAAQQLIQMIENPDFRHEDQIKICGRLLEFSSVKQL